MSFDYVSRQKESRAAGVVVRWLGKVDPGLTAVDPSVLLQVKWGMGRKRRGERWTSSYLNMTINPTLMNWSLRVWKTFVVRNRLSDSTLWFWSVELFRCCFTCNSGPAHNIQLSSGLLLLSWWNVGLVEVVKYLIHQIGRVLSTIEDFTFDMWKDLMVVMMAPKEMAAVLRSHNQLCYCVCIIALFVTYFGHNVAATVSYGRKSFLMSGQWLLTLYWGNSSSTSLDGNDLLQTPDKALIPVIRRRKRWRYRGRRSKYLVRIRHREGNLPLPSVLSTYNQWIIK